MTVPVLSEEILSITTLGIPTDPLHTLTASPESCHWGYLDASREPVLSVDDGTVVEIETITHRAGDAPDLLMDATVRSIYDGIPGSERGPGPHVVTGPIEISGAEPGSTLVVQIGRLTPRLPFGSNLAARNGLLYGAIPKERATIYEIDGDGPDLMAHPRFGIDLGPEIYTVPGYVTKVPAADRRPFSAEMSIPVRPHLGIIGVAPDRAGRLSTAPPGTFGGNVDDWRFGAGATICYPIYEPGARFYVGDPHISQGDGEISGTAIEASLTAVVRLSVADDVAITSPLLESSTEWVTHGFGGTLDEAMQMAADQTMWLLVDRFGFTVDDAYSVCSVAVDFGVTQVVDGVVGCHGIVGKSLFV